MVYRLHLNEAGHVTFLEQLRAPPMPYNLARFGAGILWLGRARQANEEHLAAVASNAALWLVRMPPMGPSTIELITDPRTDRWWSGISDLPHMTVLNLDPAQSDSISVAYSTRHRLAPAFKTMSLSIVPSPSATPTAAATPSVTPSTRAQAALAVDVKPSAEPAPESALVVGIAGSTAVLVGALIAAGCFIQRGRNRRAAGVQGSASAGIQSSGGAASPSPHSHLGSKSVSHSRLVGSSQHIDASNLTRIAGQNTTVSSPRARPRAHGPRAVPQPLADEPGTCERSACAKLLCETTVLWGVCFRVDLRLCCRSWAPATRQLEERVRTARVLALGQLVIVVFAYVIAYLLNNRFLAVMGLLAFQSAARNSVYCVHALQAEPGLRQTKTMVAAMAATSLYCVAGVASTVAMSNQACIDGGGCPIATDAFTTATIMFWIAAVAFAAAAVAAANWLGQVADIVKQGILTADSRGSASLGAGDNDSPPTRASVADGGAALADTTTSNVAESPTRRFDASTVDVGPSKMDVVAGPATTEPVAGSATTPIHVHHVAMLLDPFPPPEKLMASNIVAGVGAQGVAL